MSTSLEGAVDYPALAAEAVRAEGYEPRPLGGASPILLPRGRTKRRNAEAIVLAAAVLAAPVSVLEMGGHMSPAFAALLHRLSRPRDVDGRHGGADDGGAVGPGRRFFALGLPRWCGARPI